MSEGPIFHARRATTVPPISIPDSQRICARKPGTWRAECGRGKSVMAEQGAAVTCPECLSAMRADAAALAESAVKPTTAT